MNPSFHSDPFLFRPIIFLHVPHFHYVPHWLFFRKMPYFHNILFNHDVSHFDSALFFIRCPIFAIPYLFMMCLILTLPYFFVRCTIFTIPYLIMMCPILTLPYFFPLWPIYIMFPIVIRGIFSLSTNMNCSHWHKIAARLSHNLPRLCIYAHQCHSHSMILLLQYATTSTHSPTLRDSTTTTRGTPLGNTIHWARFPI